MIRVIILEDEFFAAAHLRKMIESLGLNVVGVYYSGEAFLKETDWEFDIAIVDVFLSEKMSGFKVAEVLNKYVKPFIFLTANQDVETVKKATKLSPFAYLSKPFKPNDISAAIEIVMIRIKQGGTRKYDIFLRENELTKEALTAREIEVLQAIVENQSVQDISDELFISKNTVKYHTKNLYLKLDENSRKEIQEKVSAFLKL
jgi:DNA-binding NarL/FixJ family response regulator